MSTVETPMRDMLEIAQDEMIMRDRILEILKGVDYNGWMSVVYEGWEAEPSGTAVPKAVAHLRTLLADADM